MLNDIYVISSRAPNDQSGSASLKILTFLSMGKGLKREIKGVIENPEIKYQALFLQQVVL